MIMRRRHESSRKYESAAAVLWLLLPLLVLVALNTNFLPQLARYWIVGSPPWAASRDRITNNVAATRDVAAPIISSKLTCNFTTFRSNTCTMEGDVRIDGKSATVYVIVSSSTYRPENSTIKLHPYARKWEENAMSLVREVTPPAGASGISLPPCSVRHDVPAVVFSTGGYNWNIFHVMSDIVIPLYLTARQYNGRVQLLATDYEPSVVARYKAILDALSIYPVLDLDADTTVRCFPLAHVGLESHRELSIDPALSPNGYNMMNFLDFIRSTYSLQRPRVTPVSKSSGQKPRLVMILRRHIRELTNEADAIAAVMDAGFEVVAAGPEDVSDLERFAGVVNSCDVLLCVHGSGLTNMLFLPRNATVAQIIPWGELKWPCRHSYGEQVPDMGLWYAEYEATVEETTLAERYPRDHAVFTDPLSIHRQGYDKGWDIFINGQNVTLDLNRFRGFLQQLYQSIVTE
ncbi:protein O-linked-mannose beta-1,4-N-acetylglucosaminyltransferase 2-like [Panicum miliaceum]|uniref:Protein O-linked-mannose beta-1,4-N-acetylglucosaminyltransferase 2-like n=1 Tax=Panicum miliaceum TaxID=4540 RepID=A0A3L6PY62_PANMI|nr:protein O-linked-mannose beta-1,4-N-acetylglucosaminyltransferase 2-like [Panicum miliaceum]